MKTVTIVIPAYNEEARLGDTLEAVKSLDGIRKILVVNDGSTDKTAEVADKYDIELVDLGDNVGKGGAMNSAIPYIDTDIIVFLDADLGSSASEATKIIKPLLENRADLVIAAFPPPTRKGGFGLVKKTAAKAIKQAGEMEVTAPLSGQRAMTKEVLKVVTPFSEAYGVELAMTIKALKHGFKVIEVPTLMKHNETGRDLAGFKHRGKQFMDVVKVIFKLRWEK